MQWDKVKNVLIAILLAVDLFLLGNLGAKLWHAGLKKGALEADVRSLVSGYGLTFSDSFSLPEDKTLITLTLDRDRVAEEKMADRMLGGNVSRTELDDGAVLFESPKGAVEWSADGKVNGVCRTGSVPSTESQAGKEARKLLGEWGLGTEGTEYSSEGLTVLVKGKVAHQDVFNRNILLTFENDGALTVTGRWSFGTPYAAARENTVSCAAADALLAFSSELDEAGKLCRWKPDTVWKRTALDVYN